MITLPVSLKINAIVLGAGLAAGIIIGMKITSKKDVIQNYTPEVVLANGSKILEKKPLENPVPKTEIPNGSQVLRTIQLSLKPIKKEIPGTSPQGEEKENTSQQDQMTINLTEIVDKNGQERVVVNSKDFDVSGVDYPIASKSQLQQKEYKWEVGASYNLQEKSYGTYVKRSIARLTVGARIDNVYCSQEIKNINVSVEVGYRF